MIYAIRAIGSGFIKFGRANSVGRRLKELETASPHELEIVAVVDWRDGAETAIHRILEKQWERGEWFRESQETEQMVLWMRSNDQAKFIKAANARGKPEWWLSKKEKAAEKRELKEAGSGLSLAHARDPESVARRRAERSAWWAAKCREKYAQERGERATSHRSIDQ